MEAKIATSRLAVLVAGGLGAAKLAVGLATGSLSVTASAADSILDAFVSGMNLFALVVASRPPDADHRFGHGKAEGIAALLQGVLLAGVGCAVVGEAVRRLLRRVAPSATLPGIAVMGVALAVTVLLVRRMQRVGTTTQSLALLADARHYASDILVNLGVIAGLVLYQITHLAFLDPALSILLALPILKSAWDVLASATDVLMDRELPAAERERVVGMIKAIGPPVVGYHGLRTRHSGAQRYVEVHLHVMKDVSFEEAHRLTHVLEQSIAEQFAGAHVTVHAEPVDEKGERVHAG
ncbi:MAG: cation diffusion facilitator family transporter [Planctomycetota bacterium]